jgi:hypothetical protein
VALQLGDPTSRTIDWRITMTSLSSRAAAAHRAVSVIAGILPAYPDPSTPTGWADVPSALVVADLTGCEDIEYTAMIDRSIICVDDATLAVTRTVDGVRLWLLGLRFANGLADLDLAGLARPDDVAAFAAAEIILVTTEARMSGATAVQVAALIMVSNDRDRWSDAGK